METKTIKISKKNYHWLCQEAGRLQEKERKMISIDDALTSIHNKMKVNFSDLAGLWKTDKKEADKLLKEI